MTFYNSLFVGLTVGLTLLTLFGSSWAHHRAGTSRLNTAGFGSYGMVIACNLFQIALGVTVVLIVVTQPQTMPGGAKVAITAAENQRWEEIIRRANRRSWVMWWHTGARGELFRGIAIISRFVSGCVARGILRLLKAGEIHVLTAEPA